MMSTLEIVKSPIKLTKSESDNNNISTSTSLVPIVSITKIENPISSPIIAPPSSFDHKNTDFSIENLLRKTASPKVKIVKLTTVIEEHCASGGSRPTSVESHCSSNNDYDEDDGHGRPKIAKRRMKPRTSTPLPIRKRQFDYNEDEDFHFQPAGREEFQHQQHEDEDDDRIEAYYNTNYNQRSFHQNRIHQHHHHHHPVNNGDNSGSVGQKYLSPEEKANLSSTFSWLTCTRFKPPKLPRSSKKRVGCKRYGRGPRIPFAPHQIAVLESTFSKSQYLSSDCIHRLADTLHLSETRVKIWFQNRRARFRREKEPQLGSGAAAAATATAIQQLQQQQQSNSSAQAIRASTFRKNNELLLAAARSDLHGGGGEHGSPKDEITNAGNTSPYSSSSDGSDTQADVNVNGSFSRRAHNKNASQHHHLLPDFFTYQLQQHQQQQLHQYYLDQQQKYASSPIPINLASTSPLLQSALQHQQLAAAAATEPSYSTTTHMRTASSSSRESPLSVTSLDEHNNGTNYSTPAGTIHHQQRLQHLLCPPIPFPSAMNMSALQLTYNPVKYT